MLKKILNTTLIISIFYSSIIFADLPAPDEDDPIDEELQKIIDNMLRNFELDPFAYLPESYQLTDLHGNPVSIIPQNCQKTEDGYLECSF